MKAVSFDFDGYLEFARDCISTDGSDEGLLRTAISRAYYAAFHAARSYAQVQTRGAPNSHQMVWDALRTCRGSKPNLARLGEELKRARLKADYEHDFGGDVSKAAVRACNIAQTIVSGTAAEAP